MRGTVALWGLLGSVGGYAQSPLPELKTHLDYARWCLREGALTELQATVDVLAPERLTFYLDPRSHDAESCRLWRSAFESWSNPLRMEFEQVDDPERANVRVILAHDLSYRGQSVGGFTFWQRGAQDSGPSLRATIFLARESRGRRLSEAARRHAAMHEIGHVLGLDDSSDAGLVMSPLRLSHPVMRPAASELATLRRVRRQARACLEALVLRRLTNQ